MKRIFLFAGCLAAATMAAFVSAPPVLMLGIALTSVLALFAPEPFRATQSTPSSIFETRRAGLA